VLYTDTVGVSKESNLATKEMRKVGRGEKVKAEKKVSLRVKLWWFPLKVALWNRGATIAQMWLKGRETTWF
jgi:hypothetical protein